jgi:hypothetical protein
MSSGASLHSRRLSLFVVAEAVLEQCSWGYIQIVSVCYVCLLHGHR